MAQGEKGRPSFVRPLLYFLGSALVVTALFGARLLATRGFRAPVPPVYLVDVFYALLILAAGYLASFLAERYVFRYTAVYPGLRRQTTLRFLTRLFIYLAVALALLAAFGVGLAKLSSSALFGGAFLTVVVGLAGQTIFANLLAGVTLVLTRPFDVGDRISFVTWQYPVMMPSYPHGPMTPAYTGEVVDLGIVHTVLRTDEGPVMLIPNGIIMQAAIENLSRSPRLEVRFRFEVETALDPGRVEESLLAGLAGEAWVVPGTLRVGFVDLAPAAYSLAVVFRSRDLPAERAAECALKKTAAILHTLAVEKAPA